MDINTRLAAEFNIKLHQVENKVKLIDEGNTIPFIARYRKEVTGSLDDQLLRNLNDRLVYLRNMEERKEEIKRLIDEQGKLTEELVLAIDTCEKLTELEDIYRPYRPKRRTRATIAKEKGLEPLAEIIMAQNIYEGNIDEICAPFIDAEKEVNTTEDALAGAMDIIAEEVSDNADYRKFIRIYTMRNGTISSKATNKEETEKKRDVYQMYHDFTEPLKAIARHRVLALNRGEAEEFLSVKIEVEPDGIISHLNSQLIPEKRSITTEYVELAAADAYKRLIMPSIENELRNQLTDNAQEGAMKIFSENLKNLLLQAPIKNKVVLGYDPGYRTGCKLAVVDGTGRVLDIGVIYPTPPTTPQKIEDAKKKVSALIEKHKVDIISIGNGTASKESEIFIAGLIKETGSKAVYIMTSESGASVYSASKLAAEEFPDFDVSQRSAVSIARRIQDPLAELVKIDPKSIGVGQYQHDMNQKRLSEALGGVVEDCVNSVGVDLNTASPSLLSYISGINGTIAKNIVVYREENGKFKNRTQLKKVAKLGPKAFEQCAGFLRITDGDNILDNTSVHPESYDAAKELIETLGFTMADIGTKDFINKLEKVNKDEVAAKLGIGVPTLNDIISELKKPGRDPRDEVAPPVLRTDVMDMNDLKPGMIMDGTVRNVIDFGAFVDIGVHQDGLVHISQISTKYIKHPMEAVSIGDVVKVKILDVDVAKKRISLTMKDI
ncbi:MAG: RNA-binding transcriptional accessory protein [Clostridia bacterium]|nr:RNA-binding transcriptional accessory protein [Clostridia bacterium]